MPRRLLALLTVAVLAAACGDSGSPDAEPDDPGGQWKAGITMSLEATDFAFDDTKLEADPDGEVALTFVNAGNVPHTFTIEELDVDVEAASGEEVQTAFITPSEDATLEFVCRFHPSEMKGTITVGKGGDDAGSGGGSSKDETEDDFDY